MCKMSSVSSTNFMSNRSTDTVVGGVRIYSADSPLRNPASLLRTMWSDLLTARELAWRLTIRDFSAQYRQSLVGYLWAFLPPFVASFTFILLRSGGMVSTGHTTIPYGAHVIIGTLLWQVFADAVLQPIRVMQSSKQMLIKINFPREALILAAIQYSGITLAVRVLILVPVLIYFRISIGWEALCIAPIGMLFLVLLGITIGILLAPLGGLYKDVQQGLLMIMTFWMFLTPVIFVGTREGLLGDLMYLNPVTHILPPVRNWLTGQAVSEPDFHGFVVVAACTLMLLGFGWLGYRVLLPRVIERLGM